MISHRLLLILALLPNLATLHQVAYPQTPVATTGWEPKTLAFELEPQVVLKSPQPRETDIFIMDSLGSKPRRLAEGESPALSPDGKQIAYCIREGHWTGQIQVINVDGSGRRQLTKVKGGACDPQWSPDGRRIAFTAYKGERGAIYITDKNGDNATQITEGFVPRWSPDGTRIIFFRNSEGQASKGSIWTANADGSEARKVVEDSSLAWATSWGPDGKSVAFACERDHRWVIFRVNLDGANLEQIASAEKLALFFPVFSPDGQQLVVDANDGSGQGRSILLINLGNKEAKILAPGLHPSVLWIKK